MYERQSGKKHCYNSTPVKLTSFTGGENFFYSLLHQDMTFQNTLKGALMWIYMNYKEHVFSILRNVSLSI